MRALIQLNNCISRYIYLQNSTKAAASIKLQDPHEHQKRVLGLAPFLSPPRASTLFSHLVSCSRSLMLSEVFRLKIT